jgi:hypothetical protein
MLVGNKCDLDSIREVSRDEGKSLAEEESLFFMRHLPLILLMLKLLSRLLSVKSTII